MYQWSDAVPTRCGYKEGYAHEACLPTDEPTPQDFDSFNISSLLPAVTSGVATPPAAAAAVPVPSSSGTSSSSSSSGAYSPPTPATSDFDFDSPPAKKLGDGPVQVDYFFKP